MKPTREKKMHLTLYTCRPDKRFVRRFDITNPQSIVDCYLMCEDYSKESTIGGDLECLEVWISVTTGQPALAGRRDVFFWGIDKRMKNPTGGVSLDQAVKDRVCGTCLDLVFSTQEMMRDDDGQVHHPKCLTGKHGYEIADQPLDESAT